MQTIEKLREKDKFERTSLKVKEIDLLLKDIDAKTKKALKSLIDNAVFMAVTLDQLQDKINRNGTTETYQNGATQYGIKQSCDLISYNTMIKNFMGIMKQLTDLVPKQEAKPKSDGFDEFVLMRDDVD